MDIEVRSHFGRDGEGQGLVPGGVGGDPLAGKDARGVLQGDQGLSSFGGGDIHGGLFTGLVAFLVGGEGQHRQGVRILPAAAAAVGRPVDDDGLSGDVAAFQVTDDDQVVAPVRFGRPDGEGDVLVAGSQFSGCDGLRAPVVHVAPQIVGALLPPPAPVELVHAVFQLPSGEALAALVHDGDSDRVVLVGIQLAFGGEFDAHVGRERGVGDRLGGETLVSAAFQDRRDDEGLEHAGSVLCARKVEGNVRHAVLRQDGVEQGMLAGLEGRKWVAEQVAVIAREGGSPLGEGHHGVGLEPGRGNAREPGGGDPGLVARASVEDGTGYFQIDFQAVGFDGFDMEALVEGGAAHLDIGVPPAGGIVGRSGDGEGVEAVLAGGEHPGVELALRGVEFQGGRKAFGKALLPVGEDHGHVQGVARAPDASFPIDEAFQALLDGLAAHVEAAHGLLVAVGEAEVARGLPLAGEQEEGLPGHLELGEALAVGLSGPDALELEVIRFQVNALGRLRVAQVRHRGPEGVAVGILGEEAQVGGQQVHGREPVGLHIIGRLLGVVLVLPVIFVPVDETLPHIGVLDVPGGFFRFGGTAAPDREHLRGGLAAVQGVFLPEGKADAVDGARLLPEQAAQVDAEIVPFVQVLHGVPGQGNLAAVHQAAGAAQAGLSVQLVLLQEQQDVVLIDLDHPQVHGRQVHRAERQDEVALVGEDVPAQGNLHGRGRVGGGEGGVEILGEALPAGAFHRIVDGQGEAVLRVALIVDAGDVVPQVDALPHGPLQGDEAFPGRRLGERLAEADLHAGVPAPDHAGVHHPEGPGGRDDGLDGFRIAETIDFQGNLDRNILGAPGDAGGFETIAFPFPGEGDGNGRLHGEGDVLLRRGGAQGDGAFQAGVALDDDPVQGQGGGLRGHLELEREFLAGTFLHVQHLADPEGSVIDGPALPGLGHEFDHGRAEPPFGAGEFRAETEQSALLALHGNGGGQFDADGRSVGDDSARVGRHIGGESRVEGLRILRRTGRQNGKKGRQGP